MKSEVLELTNSEGVLYSIPVAFAGKETCIGDKVVSYQLLRLKRSGLFSGEELYHIAATIQETDPKSRIDWVATFIMLEKDSARRVRKKLKLLHHD